MTAIARIFCATRRGSDFELAYASPIIDVSKGADAPSILRHNSKKTRPRSHYDEAGKMGQDGRQRRSQGSSDDEGKMTPDGLYNEDLRVGGPDLCSIPLSTTILPNESPLSSLLLYKSSNGQEMWERIDHILTEREIHVQTSWMPMELISVCLRQSKYQPEPHPVPTLVIIAKRQKVNNSWLEAVRDIRKLLTEENFQDISVEIQDPQALSPPITSPVLPSDQIHRQWDDVLARILTMFRTTIGLQEILSIGCYRRGRSQDTAENAPTVLVMVETTSRRNWKIPRDFITQILSDCHLPNVAVEIVKDRINLHQGSGFNQEVLNTHAVPGGPIAPLQNQNASGTLGGFIELQGQEDSHWRRFALTCFHVIDIDKRDVLTQHIKVSHPSLLSRTEQEKLDYGVISTIDRSRPYKEGLRFRDEGIFDRLGERKQKGFHEAEQIINNTQAKIDLTANFFKQSQNVLGTVSAGSGLRTAQRHNREGKPYLTRVDWAIINVDRQWTISNRLDNITCLYEVASTESLSALEADSNEERELHFQGYRSGRRTVLYSGLKVAKIEQEPGGGRTATLEYSICGNDGNPPTVRGDSGALLFQGGTPNLQEVVGMIFAGCEVNNIAYFTRIDELSEDIRRSTGATDFRMLEQ